MTTWGARFPLEDAFRGSDAERVYARFDWMARWTTGPSVLDVGCSHGSLVKFIGDKNVERYLGVDFNPAALRHARTHYNHSWTEFSKEIPEGEKFKTIVLGEVLEHQEDPVKLLTELKEHLAPDGIFVITVPHGHDEVSDHRQVFLTQNFCTMLVKAGLGTRHISFEGERIRCVADLGDNQVYPCRYEAEENLNRKHKRMLLSYRILERNYEAVTGVLWLKKAKKLWKQYKK